MDAELEDGTEVILEGDIDYWVEGGKIDLKPWEVIVVGDGDQAATVERLRSELDERDWFDDEQKQRPPAFPERIGVVTSLRGDARYDIQSAITSPVTLWAGRRHARSAHALPGRTEAPRSPIQLCARCSPGGLATHWTRDLEEHLVATPAD